MYKVNLVKERQSGFTLIELLVVIAIISILASILFPVFARARESARRASCLSNMKQIGLGIMQYVQDYDDHYPLTWFGRTGTYGSFIQTEAGTPGAYFRMCDPGSCGSGGAGHFITWMDMIFPYVKSVQVFVCPSSKNDLYSGSPVPNYWISGAYGNVFYSTATSTSAGNYGTHHYGNPILHTSTTMSAISRPSESIMIFDASGNENSYARYLLRGTPTAVNNDTWKYLYKVHLEGTNLAYGDGHVKWISHQSLASRTGTGTSDCNLNSIDTSQAFCSDLWNPFLP